MRTVGLELSEYELQQIVDKVDLDGSGNFDFSEFVEVSLPTLLQLPHPSMARSEGKNALNLVLDRLSRFSCRR